MLIKTLQHSLAIVSLLIRQVKNARLVENKIETREICSYHDIVYMSSGYKRMPRSQTGHANCLYQNQKLSFI